MSLLNIILIIIFCVMFYIYGILLSKIIDYMFPDIETKHDGIIMLETFTEIVITYLIYYLIYHHIIEEIVYKMFKNIDMYYPPFMNVILILIDYQLFKESRFYLVNLKKSPLYNRIFPSTLYL